ncbi:Fc.00g059430.m01.CDS01 [Cosmosporella sp. VM-42]
MFRRNWSSLPKDASFPSDLKGLGYFVNDEDEIRSIENPDCYFKYFLNKNLRINDRQRFEFNGALEKIVVERLENEGLQKLTLPLESPRLKPHVPIFASPNLRAHSRVVVIFGEPTQDLGIVAGRMANGPGGVDKGSMVSVVRALKGQETSSTNDSPPGIILANMGQRYWWPECKRAITVKESAAIPLPSMVHAGRKYVPAVNDIPGSETPLKHVESIFREVLANYVAGSTKIDLIAIGESCEVVEIFLNEPKNWEDWGERLNAMVLLDSAYTTEHLTNEAFEEFLAKRACGYIRSEKPMNTPVAPPEGNKSLSIDSLGTPCYSSGEPWYTEMILISALKPITDYLKEVALTPDFENPPITVAVLHPEQELTEEDWDKLPEEMKPEIAVVNPEALRQEVKQLRKWKKFEETGQAPGSDDGDSDAEEVPRENPLVIGWDNFGK